MTISANFPNVQPSLLLDFANAKQLPPQVTFTRATTGAYYDGSTTALAEQNLALQSQSFSTSPWNVSNGSVTLDTTTAPDGTTTADLLYPSGSSVVTSVSQGSVSNTANITTQSVYAKANGIPYIWFIAGNNSSAAVWFNVSTGAVGTVVGGYTASIVSVGSGWYRCIATGSFASFQIGLSASDGTYTSSASGTNGVYFWGCQAETRSTVTAYTATTTQPITNYIPVLLTAGGGQPRFDHNPTTSESLGLLIEEARTNQCLQSENFTTTWSSANQVSITSNTIIAPNGTLTGDKLIADATSNVHFVVQNTGSISAPWTFSCYAKAGEYSRVGFSYSATGYVFFNLSTGVQEGTVGGAITGTSITAVGNGWYRISFTSTSTASGSNIGIYVYNTTYTSGIPTFTGNGFSGAYIWGAQLEASNFATSYIPTTTAAATRAEDNAQLSGNNFTSWFNNDEGTIYTDTTIVGLQASAFPSIVALADADPNVTNLGIGVGTSGGQYFSSGWLSGSIQYNINIGSGVVAGTSGRTIVGYAANDFAASANAGTVGTASSGKVAPFTRFLIGGIATYQPKINAWYKKVAYYPQRVTNAQLQALTS